MILIKGFTISSSTKQALSGELVLRLEHMLCGCNKGNCYFITIFQNQSSNGNFGKRLLFSVAL